MVYSIVLYYTQGKEKVMQGSIYVVFYDRTTQLLEDLKNKGSFFVWLFRMLVTKTTRIYLAGETDVNPDNLERFSGYRFTAWRANFIREFCKQRLRGDTFIIVPEFLVKDASYAKGLEYHFGRTKVGSRESISPVAKGQQEWECGQLCNKVDYLVTYQKREEGTLFFLSTRYRGWRSLVCLPSIRTYRNISELVAEIFRGVE